VRGTLPASSSRHSQFGMHAAFPVNDQDDLTGLGIGIDDDFVNECSNEAFLQSDIACGFLQTVSRSAARFSNSSRVGTRGLTAAVRVLLDALPDFADTLQCGIPASLQLVGA